MMKAKMCRCGHSHGYHKDGVCHGSYINDWTEEMERCECKEFRLHPQDRVNVVADALVEALEGVDLATEARELVDDLKDALKEI